MIQENFPGPVPDALKLSSRVGMAAVPQQTPRAVTSAPPSSVTLPPTVAEMVVISIASSVVRTGRVGSFTQLLMSSVPVRIDAIRNNPGSFLLPDIIFILLELLTKRIIYLISI